MTTSLIWTEFGKPQLNGKVRRLEAYDGHQLTLLGSLTCDVEWNGSKYRQQQLAVVQSDKKFGLLGRDILPQEGVNAVSDEKLPAVKGYKAHVNLIPGSQPMFCKARKIPLPEILKTASARITRWAIALMGFDFELKYTPGEQIPTLML